MNVKNYLINAKLIFWDFDGVIKDSVEIKSKAFADLFTPYGKEVVGKVLAHHESNCGVSRYKKIPMYFREFLGIDLSSTELGLKYDEFSNLVMNDVISSDWIPGVEKFLKCNPYQQIFILVTGTPQKEIEKILTSVGLDGVFESVYGSPNEKTAVVEKIIKSKNISCKDALFIGDARVDLDAASENEVPFILRKTTLNKKLFKENNLLTFSNFLQMNFNYRNI